MSTTTRTLRHFSDTPWGEVVVEIVERSATEGLPTSEATGTTALGHRIVSRATSFMLPVAVAASIAAPDSTRTLGRIIGRGTGSSPTPLDYLFEDESWRYVPEFVTREQVRELNRLLALPIISDMTFDYHAED